MLSALEYIPYKIGTLCSHSITSSSTNNVELICKQRQNVIHKVSQFGKICNKCASLISKSVSQSKYCLCCANQLDQYLRDHWICSHADRDRYQILIKCLESDTTHQVSFKSAICTKCHNKIRAAFMYAKQCLVCNEKQNQVFENVQKTITLPAYYYYQNIIRRFRQQKIEKSVARDQIELFCLAGKRKQAKCMFQDVLEHLDKNLQQYHISKRYDLYPKCQKHRDDAINVCNNCIVSLLNIQSCPYGCEYQKKDMKKVMKSDSKISETGFVSLYPKVSINSEQYLEYFVFKHFQQPGRLDRWQTHIRKIRKSQKYQKSIIDKFTLFASAIQYSKNRYLYTGGAYGQDLGSLKTVSNSFWIDISADRKHFSVEDTPSLNQVRSSHGMTVLNSDIYVIGGFNKQKACCLSSCQKFIVKQNKWVSISSLKIQRSKPTVFSHNGYIYALGGLSSNPQMMNNICQRYDPKQQKWSTIQYNGFDIPYLNGSVALNTIWDFPSCDNILTIGGSNYEGTTYFIQSIKPNGQSFSMNVDGMPDKINYGRIFPAMSLMKISKTNEFIVMVFGGVEQHEELMTVDAIRMHQVQNNGKKTMQVLFTYDQVMIGSYKFLLRENTQNTYGYMMKKLEKQGILNKLKYDEESTNILKSQFNTHMIEKMWYGIGKCMVGLDS